MTTSNFKIDFIGIGASKAATTWIFDCLAEHPQVCDTKKYKELDFFNNYYEKGVSYYQSFFKSCPPGKLKGESTPGYLFNPKVAARIKHCFPKVKLIVCLRNPIERAFSQYNFDKKSDFICAKNSFEKALKLKPSLIKQGFYYSQLKRYFDLFSKENILVLIYEDIKKDPVRFIQSIYKFLKIDDKYIPKSISNPSNKRLEFRSVKLQITLYKIYTKLKLNRLFKKLNLEILARAVKRLNTTIKSKREEMTQETRSYLQKIYQEDIKKLENLIQKDLSFWK